MTRRAPPSAPACHRVRSAGVPYLLKDLYAWQKGARIGNGSRLYDGFVADHDFTLVERYKAAGLVILDAPNTPEFGLNAATEPVVNGPTRNPWNLERSSGGLERRRCAAVAAGMVPAAHGTDGGGSIRIPAANCGLFGLKPNRGRNPAGPDVGEGWSGLACGHALTRSVRDSAALLDATSGPAPGDPYWAPPPARPFLQEVGAKTGQAAHRAHEEAHHGHARACLNASRASRLPPGCAKSSAIASKRRCRSSTSSGCAGPWASSSPPTCAAASTPGSTP